MQSAEQGLAIRCSSASSLSSDKSTHEREEGRANLGVGGMGHIRGGGCHSGQHLVQLLEEVGVLLALLESGVRVGLLHGPLPCCLIL